MTSTETSVQISMAENVKLNINILKNYIMQAKMTCQISGSCSLHTLIISVVAKRVSTDVSIKKKSRILHSIHPVCLG